MSKNNQKIVGSHIDFKHKSKFTKKKYNQDILNCLYFRFLSQAKHFNPQETLSCVAYTEIAKPTQYTVVCSSCVQRSTVCGTYTTSTERRVLKR